jgi:hypothetical protein
MLFCNIAPEEENWMRILKWAAVALIFCSSTGLAQHGSERRGWAYGFGGLGGSSQATSPHVGGGGEFLIVRGFGVTGEGTYIGSTSRFGHNQLGIVSVNLGYHFGARNTSRKAVPFVTGGLSLGNARAGGGNIGFGLQYWMREQVALRFEFREHIFSSDSPYHYGFHFGLAFR